MRPAGRSTCHHPNGGHALGRSLCPREEHHMHLQTPFWWERGAQRPGFCGLGEMGRLGRGFSAHRLDTGLPRGEPRPGCAHGKHTTQRPTATYS